MKNKGIMISALGVAALSGAILAGNAFASNGNEGKFGRNYSPERHMQMTEAFANKDYTAWKNLMGNTGAGRIVTQENFAKFTEMHDLKFAGKTDEANKIHEELGMGNRQGRGINREGRGQNHGGKFIDNDKDGVCDRM
jgi:hypothetical protein